MWTALRKTLYRARGYLMADLGGEPFRVDPYHSRFWRKASAGKWEPETFAVLDRHLSPDRDYLDIGAWIGPTVLFAARKARRVITVEPDPAAFRALHWNLELNGLENVTALPVALADTVGVTRMAGMRGERGDSTTSLLNPTGAAGSDVLTLDWVTFSASVDLSAVGLVKIDVEGAEYDLVPQMADWLTQTRPPLLLSTHAPYLPEDQRAQRMTTLLDALHGYDSCQDPETGADISRSALMGPDALNRFRTLLFL